MKNKPFIKTTMNQKKKWNKGKENKARGEPTNKNMMVIITLLPPKNSFEVWG